MRIAVNLAFPVMQVVDVIGGDGTWKVQLSCGHFAEFPQTTPAGWLLPGDIIEPPAVGDDFNCTNPEHEARAAP